MLKKGILYVIVSTFCYGCGPLVVKGIYSSGVDVFVTVFFRFLVTLITFAVFTLLIDKKLFIISKKNIGWFSLLGVLYLSVISFCQVSIKYIPIPIAILLVYTYPLMITICKILFSKTKVRLGIIVYLTFAIVGMVFLLGTSFASINLLGSIFALCSAVSFAAYVMLCNSKISKVSPYSFSLYTNLFSTIGILAICMGTGQTRFVIAGRPLLYLIVLGVISTVVPYLAFLKGLALIGSTKAAVLAMLEPFFSIILSGIFMGVEMSLLQWFGGGILLLCSIMIAFEKKTGENVLPLPVLFNSKADFLSRM